MLSHHKSPPTRRVLTLTIILDWADDYFGRQGKYPHAYAGRVADSTAPLGMNWRKVDNALRNAYLGLPGGMTLAGVLQEFRGVRNRQRPPRLSHDMILAWADAHHAATSTWPTENTGPV